MVPASMLVQAIVLAILREVPFFLFLTLITILEGVRGVFVATVAVLPGAILVIFPSLFREEALHHVFVNFVVLDRFARLVVLVVAEVLVGNAIVTSLLSLTFGSVSGDDVGIDDWVA